MRRIGNGPDQAEVHATCLDPVPGSSHSGLGLLRNLAEETRALFQSLDPDIEGLTQTVCPSCKDVCCISRHGQAAADDLIYMNALAIRVPVRDSKRPDGAACRYLESSGCGLPRYARPYRCTWYFCSPLLEAMGEMKPRQARALEGKLARLSSLRNRMMEVYRTLDCGSSPETVDVGPSEP